jgi:hypothetical protein
MVDKGPAALLSLPSVVRGLASSDDNEGSWVCALPATRPAERVEGRRSIFFAALRFWAGSLFFDPFNMAKPPPVWHRQLLWDASQG